jgi:hypothetical protein
MRVNVKRLAYSSIYIFKHPSSSAGRDFVDGVLNMGVCLIVPLCEDYMRIFVWRLRIVVWRLWIFIYLCLVVLKLYVLLYKFVA